MPEYNHPKSALGAGVQQQRNLQRERDEFVGQNQSNSGLITKAPPPSEIDEEVARNGALLDEMEKAMIALHERLGPILRNDGGVAIGSNEQPVPVRQSPMANMMQARNDRIEQFINHAARIRRDLAI